MHDNHNDPTRLLVSKGGVARSFSPGNDPACLGIEALDELSPGTVVGSTFAVERALGNGGMGSVYLARNLGLGTRHAIKIIRPSLLADPRASSLFHREAMALRDIRHDAVVGYDGFLRDAAGSEYLIMDYVEGVALSERIAAGPLTVDEVLSLRDRIAAGLGVAHAKGIVHRDISPDNIVLRGGEVAEATLIDFGLTKLSSLASETVIGSSFAGKFRYASPEQLGLGGDIDGRSDIYSLGLTLAAAARGRPLDMGDSLESVIRARQGVPDLDGIPDALCPMLLAMVQPDRDRRPESMQALVERWPAHQLAETCPSRPAAPQTPHWLGWSAAIVLVISVSGVAVWMPVSPLASRPTVEAAAAVAPDDSASAQSKEPTAVAPVPVLTAPIDVGERVRLLTAAGRLLDAFTLTESLIRDGGVPSVSDSYALSGRLRDAGHLDQAVALLRWLANRGIASAAFDLAEMYDPNHWSPTRSAFAAPRLATALTWYQRAARLGRSDAQARIDALATAAGTN